MHTGTIHAEQVDSALVRLKALADEKRMRIVLMLLGGERCVCELQDALGLRQSLLSFHLRTLKDAGLVADRREGRWVHYSLRGDALAELESLFGRMRATAVGGWPVGAGGAGFVRLVR